MTLSDNFEELITTHHPIIYKICRVYADEYDFDDLYQEVLINLWKSKETFKGLSKISTWLYRIVLNTALTYSRNEKKHKQARAKEELSEQFADTPSSSDEEEVRLLYKAIAQLKKDDRSLIILYLEEKSYAEIAEITGLSESNVGVKLSRIKKRLHKILTDLSHE